jgi:hypothetical protein
MNVQEMKTSGLFLIAGVLIGLTMWFVYDRIERSILQHKAEKYFTNLVNEAEDDQTGRQGYPVKYESIRITDQNGNPVTVHSESGHPVLIYIWASWDISSLENLPAFSRLYERTKGEVDFYLLTGEEPSKAIRILKNQKLDLPCYYFARQDDLPCFLQQTELPYTCIIHQGQIRCEYTGTAPWDSDAIIHLIEKLKNEAKRITDLIPLQRINVLNVINFN